MDIDQPEPRRSWQRLPAKISAHSIFSKHMSGVKTSLIIRITNLYQINYNTVSENDRIEMETKRTFMNNPKKPPVRRRSKGIFQHSSLELRDIRCSFVCCFVKAWLCPSCLGDFLCFDSFFKVRKVSDLKRSVALRKLNNSGLFLLKSRVCIAYVAFIMKKYVKSALLIYSFYLYMNWKTQSAIQVAFICLILVVKYNAGYQHPAFNKVNN